MRFSLHVPLYQRFLILPFFTVDFAQEIFGSLSYFCHRSRGKNVDTVTDGFGHTHRKMNYEEAFGFGGETKYDAGDPESGMRLRTTYSEENIHLGPYSSSYAPGDKNAVQVGGGKQGSNPSSSSVSLNVPVVHGKDRTSGSGSVGMAF